MYPIVLNILIYVFYVCLCYPLSLFIYLKHIFILILRAFMYRIVLNILIHIHMFIKKTYIHLSNLNALFYVYLFTIYIRVYMHMFMYIYFPHTLFNIYYFLLYSS